jgi:hypothetical protein
MAQDKARPTRARKKKEDEPAGSQPDGATRLAKIVKPRSRTRAAAGPGADAVAFHAYLLWERGEPGDATEHWLRAERELAAA